MLERIKRGLPLGYLLFLITSLMMLVFNVFLIFVEN